MYIYYPSCNFAVMHRKTAKKVKEYFEKRMPVAKCCKIDQSKLEKEDIGLYVCQACRKQIEDKVQTMSLWEYFDQLDDFSFPDYHGKKCIFKIVIVIVSIQKYIKLLEVF